MTSSVPNSVCVAYNMYALTLHGGFYDSCDYSLKKHASAINMCVNLDVSCTV